jgi:hypothetical protein
MIPQATGGPRTLLPPLAPRSASVHARHTNGTLDHSRAQSQAIRALLTRKLRLDIRR